MRPSFVLIFQNKESTLCNTGSSFFVPQRRLPLFHTKHAAPTTKQYWPSTQGVNRKGIYNIHISIYTYISQPHKRYVEYGYARPRHSPNKKIDHRQTCKSRNTSRTKQQPNRRHHEITQRIRSFSKHGLLSGLPALFPHQKGRDGKRNLDISPQGISALKLPTATKASCDPRLGSSDGLLCDGTLPYQLLDCD